MAHKSLKKIYLDLLVITAGFAVLAYVFHNNYLYIFSGIAVVAALHPTTATWVSIGWEKIGKGLGWVNTRILLSVFYIIFITPFSILYKMVQGKKEKGWKNVEDSHINFNNPW